MPVAQEYVVYNIDCNIQQDKPTLSVHLIAKLMYRLRPLEKI